ncbi:methyl-accepting chemotaxis protein [Helicobacter trogontum]|uniref:Methyl-accepting chemotaxis protein n=2 Tax=Helicobacter trogontum TaxID=50960 RepID=A0A4U8SA10_9HELI|nr:methyl-accepting chemotaxis protein [Helicobacter trogontum]
MASIEFSIDGVIITANENFCKTMGYNLNEIKGKHHSMFCPKEIVNSSRYTDFWRNLRAGHFQSGTFLRIDKNGKELYLEASYNPILDSQGNVLSVIKFASDVTQATIKANDAKSVIDAVDRSMATIEFTLDGTIIAANENFCKTMGYNPDEIKGKHHRMFCEQSFTSSPDYATFWARLRDGEFQSGRFVRINKKGDKIYLEATYNPVYDPNGRVYKVIKFATDISPQVMQEQERKTNATTLAAENDRLTDNGMRIINNTTENIQKIAQTMQQSATLVDSLSVQSNEIKAVIQTIKDIADQTNLLALNAAIEAARAGEHGRGFAVVADEVRKLAERTGHSIVQITSTINSILDSTSQVVASIETSIQEIDGSVALVDEAKSCMEQIRQSASEVVQAISK